MVGDESEEYFVWVHYVSCCYVAGQCSLKHYIEDSAELCIHVVPLSVFFLVLRWRWWLLLLYQIFPVQRACRVQLQPGCYAFQIEHVVLVARQTDD